MKLLIRVMLSAFVLMSALSASATAIGREKAGEYMSPGQMSAKAQKRSSASAKKKKHKKRKKSRRH